MTKWVVRHRRHRSTLRRGCWDGRAAAWAGQPVRWAGCPDCIAVRISRSGINRLSGQWLGGQRPPDVARSTVCPAAECPGRSGSLVPGPIVLAQSTSREGVHSKCRLMRLGPVLGNSRGAVRHVAACMAARAADSGGRWTRFRGGSEESSAGPCGNCRRLCASDSNGSWATSRSGATARIASPIPCAPAVTNASLPLS